MFLQPARRNVGMGNILTDITSVLFAPLTADVNSAIVDVRNALTVITILSGIGAVTGVIALVNKR